MAIRDIEAFIRERAAQFDPSLDLSSGSPFDVQVIQPLVRRLGIDPFTVDLSTFLDARLRQAFPELAVSEGDAITDLLVKPATVLWDPIVREINRVKQGMSFRDPSIQTVEEAEALGANLFAERNVGDFARGRARIFFGQPQNMSISPVNFVTSRGGMRFFPTQVQTIRTDEMVLNLSEDGTYYFDIDVIAENAGDGYNIGTNQLVSIANVEAAIRVTNLQRFQRGEPAETAEQFIDRAQGELTEKSLVTLRGIAAKLTKAFPELRRLNVVGFNDPEMDRDIITGGGVGTILASGIAGEVADDGEYKAGNKWFRTAEVDFTSLIGSASLPPVGYVLTVMEGVDSLSAPAAQDFSISRVIDEQTVELVEQVLAPGRTALRWMLRRNELTLSGIPGGILFPDSPQGTVTVRNDQVHVGGIMDVYVRGTEFDESTLVLDNVVDDIVELSGVEASPKLLPILGIVGFQLNDLMVGTDYAINSETYQLLERAGRYGLSLQIVTGGDSTNHGVYRIVRVLQKSGFAVELQVFPDPPVPDSANYRWRLFDEINIDLVDPKETRVSGDDLITVQNSDVVETGGAINFDDLGVSEGDTLRVLDGPDAGDYKVAEAPLVPGFTSLRLDTVLLNTGSDLKYMVFRANTAGGIDRPLVRIKTVELLDSANQPLGSIVPYAKPVDIQSRAFQNPARGVKHTYADVQLGIISVATTGGIFPGLSGEAIKLEILFPDGTLGSDTSSFGSEAIDDVIAKLNLMASNAGASSPPFFKLGTDRFAVRPTGVGLALTDGSAIAILFGASEPHTTADIRSLSISDWDSLSPAVDYSSGLDTVQVINGNQVGVYQAPYSGPTSTDRTYTGGGGLGPSTALIIRDVTVDHDEGTRQFAPEENVRVQLGSRSLGSARCYFLDPTSIEFNEDSYFYLETSAGLLRFVPDPTLDHQVIPPLPSDNKSNDGESTDFTDVFTATSQSFLRAGIEKGDKLTIDYFPLAGTIVLSDPVVELAAKPSILQPGKKLVFSINNGPDLTVTFVRDDISLNEGEVSRDGVIDQINSKAGFTIAHLTPDDRLEFEADALITIRGSSNASMPSGPFLGLLGSVYGTGGAWDFSVDRTNESPHARSYIIEDVTETTLTVSPSFASSAPYTSPPTGQGFRIYRTGIQRISTTQMADQKAEASLYYFDVELVSEGIGDVYNIDADQQLHVDSFRSDGYYLVIEDENLTFSPVELPKLVVSRSIFEQGVDDDPNNATQIAGQNLQITYERSQLVNDVQNYVNSETERVGVSSILARHLIPNYIRFDLVYTGGVREETVIPLVETFIKDLLPMDELTSSDLQKIVRDQGASYIENPLDLISIVHNIDRTVQASRSQNSLSTGRLSAFIPDILNIRRNTIS